MKFNSFDLKISNTSILVHKNSDTILGKAKSISKKLGVIENRLYDEHTTMTNYLYINTPIYKMVNVVVTYDVLYFLDDFFGEDTNTGQIPDYNKIINIWNGIESYESNSNNKIDRLYKSIEYISQTIKKDSPTCFFEKYTKSVTDHLSFSLKKNSYSSVEEYIAIRLFTGGLYPVIHLIEYTHSIYLPSEISEDKTLFIEKLRYQCALIGCLSNDLFSYAKEKHSHYNLVNAYLVTNEATSYQDAISKSINKVNEIYDAFKATLCEAKESFINLNEENKLIVLTYFNALEVIVSASYHWQKSTKRYIHSENVFEDMKT